MGATNERIALVDDNDQVIGYKNYQDLLDTDCWRMVSIWIENGHGQVLMQQRSMTKKLSPGAWTPAAEGTVAVDEPHDTAAKRELAEEIGLTNTTLKPVNKLQRKFEFGSRQCFGYRTTCDWPIQKFTVQHDEVTQIAWVDKRQLMAELKGELPPSRKYPASSQHWIELFGLG